MNKMNKICASCNFRYPMDYYYNKRSKICKVCHKMTCGIYPSIITFDDASIMKQKSQRQIARERYIKKDIINAANACINMI
jgi:hypothetical protein